MVKGIKSFFGLVLLVCMLAVSAKAQGTLSGTIQSPNSSIPIANGVLTLTLNQSGVVVGSASLSAGTVSCSTSTDGSIVGLQNPLTGPMLSTNTLSGTLPAATYFVSYTAYDAVGESLVSPESSTVLLATGTVTVTLPAVPAGQTGWKVYISSATGTETQQGTTATTTFTQSIALVSGAAMPASNTTACKFRFNDSIIPYPTKYKVSLVDSTGSAVPGFNFYAYFSGSSANISNGWPLARDIETRYFTPIISSPSSNATQSINSPLTLNGFQLSAGSVILPKNASPPGCAANQSNIWTDNSGVLEMCQNGGGAVAILNTVGAWGTNGTDIRLSSPSTQSVVVGLTGSDLTTQGGGSSTGVQVGTFSYWVDTTTNAHALAMGMLASGNSYFNAGAPGGVLGITRSGTQTAAVPLMFVGCDYLATCATTVEYGRMDSLSDSTIHWKFGRLALQAGEDAIVGTVVVRQGVNGLNITNNPTNANTMRLFVASGVPTISSEITGAGTYRGLVIKTNNTEACRFDPSQNLLCGQTIADDSTGTVIEAVRSSTIETSIAAWNSANTTTGYASLYVTAGAVFGTNRMSVGVTDAAYTTAGAYFANMGFLQSNSGTVNGILVDAVAGPIALRSNGTTEASITGGTGVELAHYINAPTGLRAAAHAPVSPTGGTKYLNGYFDSVAVSAFIASADYTGPTYYPLDLASSKLIANISGTDQLWVTSSGIQWPTGTGNILGGVFVKNAGAPVYPTVASAGLNLYYDGSLDESILASYNYNAAAYKPMVFAATNFAFNSNGDGGGFWITATGPKFAGANSTLVGAGGSSFTMAAITFPGSTTGNPYVWVRGLAADGTTIYWPAWK